MGKIEESLWAPTQAAKGGGQRKNLTIITKDFEKNPTVSQKSGGGHGLQPPSSEALDLPKKRQKKIEQLWKKTSNYL